MNERIRELAEQCHHRYSEHNIDLEKFAELIVLECAKVAQDFVTVENNKLVEHVRISPWHLQDKIKEHFGVEE